MRRYWLGVLSVLLLAGCSQPTPTPDRITINPEPELNLPTRTPQSTLAPATCQTTIRIDGDPSDWEGIEPTYISEPTAPDSAFGVETVTVLVNRDSLYIMIEPEHPDGMFGMAHFEMNDLRATLEGRRYGVDWHGFGPVNVGDITGNDYRPAGINGESFNTYGAVGEVAEFRIPFAEVGGGDILVLTNFNVTPFIGEGAFEASSESGFIASGYTEQLDCEDDPTIVHDPTMRSGGFTLTSDEYRAELVHETMFAPSVMHTGPDGELYGLHENSGTILRVGVDGTLTPYASVPMRAIDFGWEQDGSLLVSTDRVLLRRGDDGFYTPVEWGLLRNLAVDSMGNMYLTEPGVPAERIDRLTPDGALATLADGFQQVRYTAIGPDDTLYALDEVSGILWRIDSSSGERTEVASGFGIDYVPGFAPDGSLYLLHWDGLFTVDPATGTVTRQTWYDPYANSGNRFAFDAAGRMVGYHPIRNSYAIDLAAQTVEVLLMQQGNTWSMAVGSDGAARVAYGSDLPGGETTVYRIGEDGLEPLATLPDSPAALAYDGLIGYVGTGEPETGMTIYRIDEASGSTETLVEGLPFANSIDVNPATGEIAVSGGGQITFVTPDGTSRSIPNNTGKNQLFLSFAPDGTLYAMASQFVNGVIERDAVRINEDGSVDVIADLTPHDPNITLGHIIACPAGEVYMVASVDGEMIESGRNWPSMNTVLAFDPGTGETRLIGYDFGVDPLAADCGPDGSLFFTSSEGVFRLWQP